MGVAGRPRGCKPSRPADQTWRGTEGLRELAIGQDGTRGCCRKTCYLLGDYTKAIEHHESALAISVAIGDRKGESCDLGHLGASYNKLEQWTEAIEYLEKALQISNEVRQQLALTTLGLLYLSA